MIPIYKNPEDLLGKLFREARRVWVSESSIDASDHLFNFCVTCISLRDWVAKYLELDNPAKDAYQKQWKANKYFSMCADIANELKHFGLDSTRKTNILGVTEYQQELVALGVDGEIVEGLTKEKTFFKISLDDERENDVLHLLMFTCKEWESLFSKYSVPKNKCPDISWVFLEEEYP